MASVVRLHSERGTTTRHGLMHWIGRAWRHAAALWLHVLLVAGLVGSVVAAPTERPHAALQSSTTEGHPLVIGQRTVFVFRAPLAAFTPAERAEGAHQRILQAVERSGEGWTSVATSGEGLVVQLDGQPMFSVLPGDARALAGETPDQLANAASRTLQKAWVEARESRDPQAHWQGVFRVALATLALVAALALLVFLSGPVRRRAAAILQHPPAPTSARNAPRHMRRMLAALASRLLLLGMWLLGLFAMFLYAAFSLAQFALTRPLGEDLAQSIRTLLGGALAEAAAALPEAFIAAIIFLAAWTATQISTQLFALAAANHLRLGQLDAHTAPATRRIVNACIWLFAVAMAYPYLPGSHTEAFQGLSVLLGLMVSLGAAGLVAQVTSGVMVVYTRSIAVGEYVRVKEHEGTVTELGPFVTRLRTGLGEEVALPNAYVLSNVVRNYSRAAAGSSFVLDTEVTIGYDTPWRQVHAMLLEAACSIPQVMTDPAPCVVQTALSDFYVAYRVVVHVDAAQPAARAQVASALRAAIQDAFNRHGVQIMSPHYMLDPQAPKVVPPQHWHTPPAPPAG